jgi:hypothetical protein
MRSALAKTFGGIVTPISLAALTFMMNSNFMGCSTGKSAGFAPFKILFNVIGSTSPSVRIASRIRHNTTSLHILTFFAHGGQSALDRKPGDLFRISREQWIPDNEDGLRAAFDRSLKRSVKIGSRASHF